MAKFCTNCGASLADTAKFCNGCGSRQDDAPPVQQQQPVQPPVQQPAQSVQQPQQQPQQPQQPQQQFQPQPQYQPPPMQQQYQQPIQQTPQAESKKKRRIPRLVMIIGIAVIVIGVGIAVAVIALNGAGNTDYFKFGNDKIPSVKLALGEERKLTSASTSAALGGGQAKVFVYQVSGRRQNDDMFNYITYLREKDGFLVLTSFDFNGPEGACIVGRNSIDDGYMIQLQVEYDRSGYTITITKQKGEITLNTPDSGNQTPGQSGNTGGDTGNNRTPAPSSSGTPAPSSSQTPAPSSSQTPAPSSSQTPAPSSSGTPDAGSSGTPTPDNSGTPDTGSLTKDIFDLVNSGMYYMKANFIADDGEFTAEIFVKNGMTAVSYIFDEGMEVRLIDRDEKIYTVISDFEMVMVKDATPDDDIAFGISPENMVYIGEGSGDFRGKTYKYDEYMTEDGMQMFYYVDGGALKGIRTISDGEISDAEILALDKNVPDSAFDIPEDFEVVEN